MKKFREQGQLSNRDFDQLAEIRTQTKKTITQSTRDMRELENRKQKTMELPGKTFDPKTAKLGDTVYLMHLRKEAQITDLMNSDPSRVEVAIGIIRSKVSVKQLRFVRSQAKQQKHHSPKRVKPIKISTGRSTFQTAS